MLAIQQAAPRAWQRFERELLWQVAVQLSVALKLADTEAARQASERERAENALRASEEQFRALSESAPVGIFRADVNGQITYVNPQAQAIGGYTFEEALGQGWVRFVHPEDREHVVAALSQAVQTGEPSAADFRYQHRDGTICWVSGRVQPVRDRNRRLLGYMGTLEDITERKQAQQALQQRAERERLFAQMARTISESLDLDAILDAAVAELRHHFGCDRAIVYRFHANWSGSVVAESVGDGWRSLLGEHDDDPCFREGYARLYCQGRYHAVTDCHQAPLSPCHRTRLAGFQVRAHLVVLITDGRTLWGLLAVQHCAQPYTWSELEIELLRGLAAQLNVALQKADLYRQLEAVNQDLHSQATHDALTNLANRAAFDRYLHQEWERLRRSQAPLSVILCDLDGFKALNDGWGYPAGDAALQQVAQLLQDSVRRAGDLAARLGGDEFACLLPETPLAAARSVAERLCQGVCDLDLRYQGERLPGLTLSVGVTSIVPNATESPEALVTLADQALYQVKAQGGNGVVAEWARTLSN